MRPLASLLLLAMPAADDPAYRSVTLKIGDRVDDVVAEDFDGDGLRDLLVQSGRDLRLFPQGPGGFRPEPEATLRLAPDTFLWCLGRYSDGPGRCVTTMSSRGLHRHPLRGGVPRKEAEDLVVHPTLFEGTIADGRPPAFAPFLPDLDGDGLDDALLFVPGQMMVLPQRKGAGGSPGFRLRQRLDIPTESTLQTGWMAHQKVVETVRVPLLVFGDVDGDGRTDIGYFRNEAVGTFLQQPDGRFLPAGTRDLAVQKRKVRTTYLKFEAPPVLRDLDGDGLLDIVVVYPSKGRVHVFLNRSGRTDFTTPDEVLSVDGWTPGVEVVDLDADGKSEIVMGVVRKLGLSSGLEAFTTKKVRLELLFFRRNAEGRYTNEPRQQLEFHIPYTFQATRESAQIDLAFRPNFEGDLDGDGRIDLIVEKDPRTFSVYPGVDGKLVADAPSFEIAADAAGGAVVTRLSAVDLNGDRKADLVIRRLGIDRRKDAVEVKLSR